MSAKRFAPPVRLCGLLAALALLALPAASSADPACDGPGACTGTFDTGATPEHYQWTIPCLTTEEGTADGTGREVGGWSFLEDGTTGHFHSTYHEGGRMDFPQTGIYVLYSFEAQGAGAGGDTRKTITFGGTGLFQGVVYDSAGEPTGQTVTDHSLVRFTFIDSGDAGVPGDSDPTDYFLVNIQSDRFNCS